MHTAGSVRSHASQLSVRIEGAGRVFGKGADRNVALARRGH